MSDLKIHIKKQSLYVRSSGVTSGEIYADFAGESFPGRGWYDAPIVLLSWWIASFRRFNYEKKIILDFMEGDRTIEISINHQSGRIKFLTDGSCRLKFDIPNTKHFLKEFERELGRCAEILIESGVSGYAEREEIEQIAKYLSERGT